MHRDTAFMEQRQDSKRWYIRYKESETNKWRRKSLGTTSRAEARKRYAKALSELHELRTPDSPTVAHALDCWLREADERDVTEKHLAALARAANDLRCKFGKVEIRAVTRSGVRDLLKIHKHRKGVGARNKLALYRMFFRWAVAERLIASDPAHGLSGLLRPSTPSQRTPRMSDEDLQALLEDLHQDHANGAGGASMLPLVRFLALTGVRSVDAVRLRWEDVNLEAQLVRITPGRGKGHSRFLPWPGEIEPPAPQVGSVFRLTKTQLEGRWRRFKARNPRWQGASLHSLRVRVNSKLVEAGHEALARAMLGHADVDMTAHYTRVFGAEGLSALSSLTPQA
jgi:integrase